MKIEISESEYDSLKSDSKNLAKAALLGKGLLEKNGQLEERVKSKEEQLATVQAQLLKGYKL